MNQDQSYLLDIAKLCQTMLRLTANMTEADFQHDERTQLAILYEITILGEVVKRLSSEFRHQHSTIAWRRIAGMRDRLVHDYDEVKLDLVWKVIKTNIPELLQYVTPLLPSKD
ncbi:MAG: HepT-like ribonuclease domain-containing protein [Cyanobacteria bacterium J06639_14]